MLWQEGRAVKTRWIANGKQPLVPVQTVAPDLEESCEATSESTGLVSSGADSAQSEESKPVSMVCEKMGPLKEKWTGLPTAAQVAVPVAGLLVVVLLVATTTVSGQTASGPTASGPTFTVVSGPSAYYGADFYRDLHH